MYGCTANAGAQNMLNAEENHGDYLGASFPDGSLPPQDIDRKVRVRYLDWLIVFLGHGILLFPFPGWPILYLLFDEARQLYTPVFGTLFSIVSIQPGAHLLARARENPDKLDLWIFYAFAVSIMSMTGLFLTIGPHILSFVPIAILMVSIGGAAYWEKRTRLEENVQVPSVQSVAYSQNFQWRTPTSLVSDRNSSDCISSNKY